MTTSLAVKVVQDQKRLMNHCFSQELLFRTQNLKSCLPFRTDKPISQLKEAIKSLCD